MDGVLISGIIDRSIIAWYCILLIIFVRLFLKRISRKYCYYLWMVVFLNLCIPFSIVSSFSLIPQRVAEFSVESMEDENQEVSGKINATQNIVVFSENKTNLHDKEMKDAVQDMESERAENQETKRADIFSKEFLFVWGERIWILGIVLLGMKSVFAIFQLNRKIRKGHSQVLDVKERIAVLQDLASPILWGFLSPVIYLPKDLEEEERVYIIEHEKCHRKRKDYLVKPVLYAITVIYWFHPLVWMAYHLCCEDMEMSCDEMVLEKAGKNICKEYAYSLLKYAAKQNGFLLHPLTFGEPSIRSRIQYILKYKKKSVSVTVAAMVVAAVVGIGLILRPADEPGSEEIVTENMGTEIPFDEGARTKDDGKNGAVLDETVDDFSNPIPGQPCERPEEAGWNLQNVTDVRNDFFRLPLEPEEEKKDATYLLGKTENYTLYGKGDYETLLLECGGKYSEITYFYASNYMDPLQLFETDIDYDGKTELAIKFRLQMGTGISIDTFLLADFGKDNELYVHQYLAEEFTKQLAEALEFEKTEDGVQAKVNGKNAGPMMENMEGRGAFHEAGVGAIMHFYYDNVENEIRLSGDILFFADGVTYETNGNDVTAKINWDGEKFFLSDFTSRNRYLEEQVEGDLSQFYGMNLYDVNVHYDASKMNQETMTISAEVLKTEADRNYEDVEIQLKQAKDSYVSGWEIEGILSKSPRTQKTTISFVVEGLKEEVPVVLYKGRDYSIYIPEEGWQMTATDIWESVHNEKVKLQIMDYGGESVEDFREQLLEEGYNLDDYNSVKLTKYASEEELIQNVRIFKFHDKIKGIFYSYPVEAEEGFGTRLERIVSTFGWEGEPML